VIVVDSISFQLPITQLPISAPNSRGLLLVVDETHQLGGHLLDAILLSARMLLQRNVLVIGLQVFVFQVFARELADEQALLGCSPRHSIIFLLNKNDKPTILVNNNAEQWRTYHRTKGLVSPPYF